MITLSIDVNKNTILSKKDIFWFRLTFICVAIGSICEFLGDVCNNNQSIPIWIHYVVTSCEFILTPFLTILLARSCGIKKTLNLMLCIFTLHLILELSLLPFHKIFYIDENAQFERGPLYWIYLVACIISFVYILSVFIYIGKREKNNCTFSLAQISLIMIIGQGAVVINENIKSGYITITITAILLYIITQEIIRRHLVDTIGHEKDIANHDPLTGVSSRIGFDRKIREIDSLIEKNRETIKFAICEWDCNNLKTINDNYGHEMGDFYIKSCCKNICNLVKHSPVFRTGGDEFVILLQNEDYEHYEELKQTLQDFVSKEIQSNKPIYEQLSFAFGFAKFNKTTDSSFSEVLNKADFEMYKNKKEIKKLAKDYTSQK